MGLCRTLLVGRDKITQTQRGTFWSFSGSYGIFPRRVAVFSLANAQPYISFKPFTVSATHRAGFSRPNPIFSYERLNWASGEIRLIELLPLRDYEDNAEDKPVACSIHHFALDNHPKYLALSYAWDNISRTESLIIDGQVLGITKSLDTALRQLRRMMENGDLPSEHRFWIDAVCINQEDDVEKTWQVRQMGQIYRNAEYTLVWLGSASDSFSTAMKKLEHVGQIAKAGKLGHMYFTRSASEIFRALPNIDVSIGTSLVELLRRPWWSRAWVVQEFSFAKDVLFICGDTTVWCQPFFETLDLIKQLMASIAIEGWRMYMYQGDYRRFTAEMSTIHNILRLFHIREKLKKEDKRLSMWELLALKRSGMQASDKRDLVYALTGLSADAASKLLYPDYSKDVSDVYMQTARAVLIEGRLRLLWFCSQPRLLKDLPSWVPDWSGPWQNDYRYLSEDGGYGQAGQIFRAAGESRPMISFSERDTHMLLHMQGYEIDTINDIGPFFDTSRIPRADDFYGIHSAISERGKALQELKRKHATAERGSHDDVIRTMITDIELYWNLGGTFRHRRASPDLIREISNTFIVRTEEKVFERSMKFMKLSASQLHILYRHISRRPFITSRGHLGLGPADMLPRDRVVVLFGAELPLILRQDNKGYYQVIGEAYVHGAMDGEVMTMGFKSKSFDIR